MHEKILQGVTVGIIGGLIVFWLTSQNHAGFGSTKTGGHGDYKPTMGDIRTVRFGTPVSACCQCCGLPTPETTSNPLATDYLDCAPQHAPATSGWNLGVSLQLSCEGIDLHSCIHRKETGSSFPYGSKMTRTTPRPVFLTDAINCSPNVPLQVDCTEVI